MTGVPPTSPDQVGAIAPPPAERGNTLGLVAFILVLCGFTCIPGLGLVAGVICAIVALRRPPRGFAIAALSVAALGGCLVIPLLLALLLPALGRARMQARASLTTAVAVQTTAVAEAFRRDNGRWPKDMNECVTAGSPSRQDGWGVPLEVRIEGDELFIWSAGRDERWGTGDDFCAASSPPDAAARRGYAESGL